MNTDRKTRGSYLFVGSFDDELISSVEQPVRSVHTVFDAIGELATCNATDYVEAVIVDEEFVTSEHSSCIEAMRRVEPSAIIVVAGEGTHHAQANVSVPKNTTSARLSSAIANAMSQPISTKYLPDQYFDEIVDIFDESVAPEDSSPLGDVDLVRSLMHNPSGFNETLMHLLVEQTGWKYCAIVDDISCAPETALTAPLRYGREEHGVLAAIGAGENEIARWSRWVACWLELSRRQRQIKLLAYQDELSGAWNRRFLQTCLLQELGKARTQRRPLTVMIFDIDNFKRYNDQWGHDAGDDIIREVVKVLRTIIRKGDHVCRIGGDEFAVLFCDPEPPREIGSDHPTTVLILAERFKEQVTRARFPKLGDEGTGVLTISGGLATFPWDGNDLDAILKKADERLFHSKRQGKNSITIGRR